MNHRLRRHRGRFVLSALAVAVIGLVGMTASGDVVLHPGTVTGTVGLTGSNLAASGGSISISNNTFSANTSFSGNSFTLTTEGNQTYNSLSWSQYGYSPNYQTFNFSTGNANLTVPGGGTVNVDVSRPGGTIALPISVSTTTDPATGAAVPQGSVASAAFWAYAYNGSEYYNGYAQGASSSLTMAMAASSSVSVYGRATINVFDASGQNVLCTTDVSFATQVVALDAGQTATVANLAQVDPSMCAAAVLKGTVGLHNTPGGVLPSQAYVYSNGPTYRGQYLSGFQAATPDISYEFDGLQKGYYYPATYLYFPAPYSGDYMMLPNQNPSYVDLTGGGTAQRDFLFDGSIAAGTFTLSGPAAGFASWAQQYFYGTYDYSQPHYGPSAGGYASSSINLSTGNYNVILTPGTWNENETSFGFSQYNQGVQYYDYLYMGTDTSVVVPAGQTVAVPPKNLSVSVGTIVFDVIEPPGSPVIGITNPSVNAYASINGNWVQVSAYAYVSNVDTPAVHLIGPPGDYNFDAYATVEGTYTKFASSTISIGTAVDTPTGTNVVVVPKDSSGNPTPVTVDFGTVTQGGSTTASVTDVGPSAPPDYSLLEVVTNKRYLNITTSATFTQAEVCLNYNPATLGITSAQESTLKLQEFTCSSASSCSWQIVNGVFPGDNGGSAVNTSTHTICGLVDQVGTFGITLPNVVLVPPTDTCVGTSDAPAQLSTDPNMCSASIDNTNQVAGGCSGGGDGLASCTFDGATSESLAPGNHTVAITGTAGDGSTATCSSYVSVVDRQPPAISCPAPTTVECTGVTTPVAVTSTCSDNCGGGCTTSCGNGSFALGDTTIACNAVDASGNKSSCDTTVHIQDTTAPSVSVSASPSVLWPPNHKLVGITLTKTAADTCDPNPAVTCTATSSEPDNGLGDGDTANDIQWVNGSLLLRAERSGTGPGRVYTITCTAKDASGNASTTSTTVTVPHAQ